jgi:AraC-like DNA-binding protein
VAEIALECGFYDHSAFTRAFRAVTSVTPTQFRAG